MLPKGLAVNFDGRPLELAVLTGLKRVE